MRHAQKREKKTSVPKFSQDFQQPLGHAGSFQFKDTRCETIVQRNMQSLADESSTSHASVQLKTIIGNPENSIQRKNTTGMPDNLKSGIENLSGMDMSDVKVQYNSSQPAQLNAHAYAQGTNIHIAPGQEKHLPHEAWHVVQQKQGRVKPTMQMKGGMQINNHVKLETEASHLGNIAMQQKNKNAGVVKTAKSFSGSVFQRVIDRNIVEAICVRLKIPFEGSKIIEVPRGVKANDKFNTYPPGSVIGLSEVEMKESLTSIQIGPEQEAEYEDVNASDLLDLLGGAAYNHKIRTTIIDANVDNYERNLLHEMGHHKQNLQGFNADNTTVMLLEWHNVLFNENLFDPAHPRIAYNLRDRASLNSERADQSAKSKNDQNKRHTIQVEMQKKIDNEYAKLDQVIKGMGAKTKKAKDLEVYTEVYHKFEMIRAAVNSESFDECFVYRCMQLNILTELFNALK